MAEPGPIQQSLEVLLWSAPAALAAQRFLITPRGARATWLLVGASCAVIALDKAIDLQMVAYHASKDTVARLAPDLRTGGSAQDLRLAILGLAALAGVGTLVALARFDKHPCRSKWIALAGLAGIVMYLAARLVPAVAERLTPPLRWTAELGCWALIVFGTALGAPAEPELVSRPPRP